MLGNSDSISFIATRDPALARSFYETTLGLTLVAEEQYALVFDLNGHTLRIATVEDLVPAGYTVLGWHVSDISTTVTNLSKCGVVFEQFEGMDQDGYGVWASPSGAKMAWFRDPDGNVLSLTLLAFSDQE